MLNILRQIKNYLPLLKSLQTGLLTITGIAGYLSVKQDVFQWDVFIALFISFVLSISGSTVLNMWYDHDIDKLMDRTHHRPLAVGRIPLKNALIFGILLSVFGVLLGLVMKPLYGFILFLGILFDYGVYTFWLKRRSCWSVVWGGLAGGMPVFAGRVLGLGHIDFVGLLLALSVLFWIPTHMLTFSIRYKEDYRSAKIPTFPSTYGDSVTRKTVAFSSIIAGLLISLAAITIGVRQGYLHALGALSVVLIVFSFLVMVKPSNKLNFGLFKYASVYMLVSMLLLSI